MNKRILETIIAILKSEPFTLNEKVSGRTKIKMLPRWDSFKHLTFLIEIEKKFNLEISPEEIASIITIKDLIKKIAEDGYSRTKK